MKGKGACSIPWHTYTLHKIAPCPCLVLGPKLWKVILLVSISLSLFKKRHSGRLHMSPMVSN